jgi:hypothetical protein
MDVRAREDLLRAGEAAIAAADWETARASLERVLEQGESPAALTGLSKIAMIDREYERAIELKERAFELDKRAGRLAAASDNAMWLAFMYVTSRRRAHGSSWPARSRRRRRRPPRARPRSR